MDDVEVATLQSMDEEVLLAAVRQLDELRVVSVSELRELVLEADRS